MNEKLTRLLLLFQKGFNWKWLNCHVLSIYCWQVNRECVHNLPKNTINQAGVYQDPLA